MLAYPLIDPIALSLGPIQIRWYGIMYLLAFGTAWLLARYRASRPNSNWTYAQIDDLLIMVMIGVILGGRLGHVLFYDFERYISNPLQILQIWKGGMSFHGGLLGVLFSFWLYGKKNGRSFLEISDFVAPLVPLGILWGRLGNFINGELWGKTSELPWAMIFPYAGNLPRHPSQLYEAFFEGLVLFILVWTFSNIKRPIGAVSGLFALGYGIFRFAIEFVREPDIQLGYLAFGWLTMGQILCIPLIAIGIWLLLFNKSLQEPLNNTNIIAKKKKKKRRKL